MVDNKTTSKNYRTFAIILLTIVYGFNFIDRQIVGILAPFIQKDLGLTNTWISICYFLYPGCNPNCLAC